MRCLILLFILFGYTNIFASDQTIRLDSTASYRNLGKSISYFEDKSAKLNLTQVQALSRGQFKQGQTNILNFGNSKSAFWLKIDYVSGSASNEYLIVDISSIENVDFYTHTSKGIIHRTAGSIHKSERGVITTNNFLFDLPRDTQSQITKTIWLRLKTNNILIVPVKMATSENFIPGISIKKNLEAMYIGVLLTLFLFNTFLYFSIKDSAYLYYSIYVISMAIYVVTYLRGYSYVLGDNFRIFINHYPHLFLSVSVISSILFSAKFLNLRKLSPKLNRTYQLVIACCLLMFFFSLIGFKSFSSTMAQLITLIASVVIWISGVVAYQKGHRAAKYYVLAWTFMSVTIVAVVLSLANILSFQDYTFDFVPVGSTIELLLLAFALGDRYRTILSNEQLVRDENYLLIQTQNQRLEKLVTDRTLKLSDTIVQLKASNAVKNKLFSIIAHDLRSPFNSLMSIFSLKEMNLLSFDELKMLLNENKKNIDTIHNTLNNLLYWAKSQMEAVKTTPTTFNLGTLIEDLTLVYAPLTQMKGINIDVQIPEQSLVYADENQIQLVLRNLIDNAIKFTPFSHTISISLSHKKEHLQICVSNTVSSTNELNIEGITNPDSHESTYGTSHEKGIGLGLHLCREYVKGNGSKLQVKINDRLVSFCFELPLVQQTNTILA
ncbi:sensor histidine kinase [Pedobacter nyackensis]|uniref:histidine kinase n=1 Tax=Pedobacter nyackensis TaxID=475255 RepID=A0A1W2F658_9SPHI|nr:sensor histidine kinase [Pedobacter nyackensis]SMD17393.1 Signal transduction histidine kinase [Pedobacter nyackensis]